MTSPGVKGPPNSIIYSKFDLMYKSLKRYKAVQVVRV